MASRLIYITFLILSCSCWPVYAQQQTTEEEKADKKTLKKIVDWATIFSMYSNVDVSDKFDLGEYAEAADLLKQFVTNPELSVRLAEFRSRTFVNVYPKGMLLGEEWLSQKLNSVSDNQYATMNAPYITAEVWFKPNGDNTSFTVSILFKTNTDALSAAVQQVNTTANDRLRGSSYPAPRDAKLDVNAALFAALDKFEATVGSTFAPNIAISYDGEMYLNGQTFDAWVDAVRPMDLMAVDKNGAPIPGDIAWTNANGNSNVAEVIVSKAGDIKVTATSGANQITITIKVKEFSLDWKELLRNVLKEIIAKLIEDGQQAISKTLQERRATQNQAAREYETFQSFIYQQNERLADFQLVDGEMAVESGNILEMPVPDDPRYKQIIDAYEKFQKAFVDEQLREVRKIMLAALAAQGNFEKLGAIVERDIAKIAADLIVKLVKGEGRDELKVFLRDYLNQKLDEIIENELSGEVNEIYSMLTDGATKNEIIDFLSLKAAGKIVGSLK